MSKSRGYYFLSICTMLLFVSKVSAQSAGGDAAIQEETMRHFQALLRLDTSDPPGNEAPAVEYLKSVLEKEGIEVQIFAKVPHRPNLVARLRGTGKKRPLLMMAHTDVVNTDPKKWKYPAFSATRADGYVYGRGAVDDKDNVTASLMTLLQLKRQKLPLDRDIIFLAEAGEEGSTDIGIGFMVKDHWPQIEAEYCFAEGGGMKVRGGKINFVAVATTEKLVRDARLVATGTAGHGSVPLRNNAIVHLSKAVARVADWRTPMRLNETTQAFFERLATVSSLADAARYKAIVSGKNTAEVEEHLAINEPALSSVLRTSISPNIIKGGYRYNVIPSEAEATLDIRALPDEDMPKFFDEMRNIINDPQIEIVQPDPSGRRPVSPPSKLGTEAFQTIESVVRRLFNVVTIPSMLTGATDMSFVRAKGVDCYGIGPAVDVEDLSKGYGAHSDQERILDQSLHQFVRFNFELINSLARAKPSL